MSAANHEIGTPTVFGRPHEVNDSSIRRAAVLPGANKKKRVMGIEPTTTTLATWCSTTELHPQYSAL